MSTSYANSVRGCNYSKYTEDHTHCFKNRLTVGLIAEQYSTLIGFMDNKLVEHNEPILHMYR